MDTRQEPRWTASSGPGLGERCGVKKFMNPGWRGRGVRLQCLPSLFLSGIVLLSILYWTGCTSTVPQGVYHFDWVVKIKDTKTMQDRDLRVATSYRKIWNGEQREWFIVAETYAADLNEMEFEMARMIEGAPKWSPSGGGEGTAASEVRAGLEGGRAEQGSIPAKELPTDAAESAPPSEDALLARAPLRDQPSPSSAPTPPSRIEERKAAGSQAEPSYGLHVESYKMEERAEDAAETQECYGWDTAIKRVDLGEKGVWYRVYIGRYPDLEAAREAARELKRRRVFCYASPERVEE